MGHSLKYICVCICVCVCLYLPGGMLSNSICYTHRALSNLLNHAISILCPISWTHIWLQHPPPPRIQVPRVIWEWRDPPIRIHFPLSFFVNLDWQGWATVAHNLHKTLGNKKSLPAMCPEYHTGAGQLTLMVSSLRRQDLLHSTTSPLSNDGAPALENFLWGSIQRSDLGNQLTALKVAEVLTLALAASMPWCSHRTPGNARDGTQVHALGSLSLPSFPPLLYCLYLGHRILNNDL